MHGRDHEVFTWSRTPSEHPWVHSAALETMKGLSLECLVVASGNTRPGLGDSFSEVNSTINLLPDSLRHETTRILYLSSGAVYGECPNPRSENDLIAPITPYGKAKAAVEKELDQIFAERFLSLRIGNVIDSENPYGLLGTAREVKKKSSLDLYGLPEDCRDYLGINDLCLMVSKILELNLREAIINLGSGVSISLSEFAAKYNKLLPNLNIRWNSPRASDISKTQLDVTKVRQLTGITPQDPRVLIGEYLEQLV